MQKLNKDIQILSEGQIVLANTKIVPYVQSDRRASEQQKEAIDEHKDVKSLNQDFDPQPSKLSAEERFNLISSVGIELIEPAELKERIAKKELLSCYDGFEPSGRIHLAQGLLRCINVNKLIDAGCVFTFFIADWHAMLNNKMQGDLTKIRTVGEYFIETWRAVGMNMKNVKFVWASDFIRERGESYWVQVLDVARKNSVTRIKRCCQIMGRKESEELSAAQLIYPCMQCTDIFHLDVDICALGLDQRKVNMLAREYCDVTPGLTKPIILSHFMLPGLQQGQQKMSKSDPQSAIYMDDSEADVNQKLKRAYCPLQQIQDNPILEYIKHLVFPIKNSLLVPRKPENGGDTLYDTYEKLEQDFQSGALHPADLKPALATAINELIEPVRAHFTTDDKAKSLLTQIQKWQSEAAKK